MRTVPLEEVSEFIRGVTFKPADVSNSGVGVMRTKNVQEVLDLSDVMRIPAAKIKRTEQYLREGDILVSSANSWYAVGKACWIPVLDEPLAIGGFVTALRPTSSDVNARYLYRWFTSPATQSVLRSFSNKTTNISNLNLRRASKMPVYLPSLETQRRIVAALDSVDAVTNGQRKYLESLGLLTRSLVAASVADSSRTVQFPEVFEDVSRGNSKVPQTEYQRRGKLPIVDQGRKAIAGYSNNLALVVKRDGPVVIFGDHTRVSKYVDFDFAIGADGVKVLKVKDHLTPKVAFHILRSIPLPDAGYSRHFKFLREIEVPLISSNAQKKLELVIGLIERLEAGVRRSNSLTLELFESLQYRAFRGDL